MTPIFHRSVLSLALLLSLAACQRNQEAEAATAKAAPAQQATHQVKSELGEVRVTEIASGLELSASMASATTRCSVIATT